MIVGALLFVDKLEQMLR